MHNHAKQEFSRHKDGAPHNSNNLKTTAGLKNVLDRDINTSACTSMDVTIENSLKQGRKTGHLSLVNQRLSYLPWEAFHILDYERMRDERNKQGKLNTLKFLQTGTSNILKVESSDGWWEHVSLKKLDISHNDIEEIDGNWEGFGELEVFLAGNNCLITMSEIFFQLPNVRKIVLSNNCLVNLPNVALPSLTELDISHNNLSTLPYIDKCIRLQVIDASNNRIKALPTFPSSTRRLLVSNNNIECLPSNIFNGLAFPYLTELVLNNNPIVHVSEKIWTLPRLVRLELRHCRIEVFPSVTSTEGPSVLSEIFLSHNKMCYLPLGLEKLSSLTILDVSNNHLVSIPDNINEVATLKVLDISNNSLPTIPPTLSLISSLSKLLVIGNPMKSIRREVIDQGTVALLSYLRSRLPCDLSLDTTNDSNNIGRDILNNAAASKFLDISNGRWNMAGFESSSDLLHKWKIEGLKRLDFSGNGHLPDSFIKLFRFKNIDSTCVLFTISTLNISSNSITNKMFFDDLRQYLPSTLTDLDLSRNALINISMSCMQSLIKSPLKRLNLSFNNIVHFEFISESNVTKYSLVELNLSHCQLTLAPVGISQFPCLEIICLSSNKISILENSFVEDIVSTNHKLHTIDLTGNELTDIPSRLGDCDWLRYLGLEGNPLRTIRRSVLDGGTMCILAYLSNRKENLDMCSNSEKIGIPTRIENKVAEADIQTIKVNANCVDIESINANIVKLEVQLRDRNLSSATTYAIKKKIALEKSIALKLQRQSKNQ